MRRKKLEGSGYEIASYGIMARISYKRMYEELLRIPPIALFCFSRSKAACHPQNIIAGMSYEDQILKMPAFLFMGRFYYLSEVGATYSVDFPSG